MKVLHIWNTAGVAGYIAEYLYEYHDIESKVLWRKEHDPYNQATSKVKYVDGGTIRFHLMCLINAMFYNIIHFHSIDRWLKYYKFLFPKKLIIIHYHGTEIRHNWKKRKRYWKHADKIIVSTPDLIESIHAPKEVIHIPNMVNFKLCEVYKDNNKYNKSSFHVNYGALDIALEIKTKRKIRMTVHNYRVDKLFHKDFLKQISMYEYYIDVRRQKGEILRNMSLTAIEALHMGVKVIDWRNKLISKLPKAYRINEIAKRYLDIYSGGE